MININQDPMPGIQIDLHKTKHLRLNFTVMHLLALKSGYFDLLTSMGEALPVLLNQFYSVSRSHCGSQAYRANHIVI